MEIKELVVGLAWLGATLAVAIFKPDYLSTWVNLTVLGLVVLLYKKTLALEKKAEVKEPVSLAVDFLAVLLVALVVFLLVVLFTYWYVHI
jgi:uncharacterized membrane protein